MKKYRVNVNGTDYEVTVEEMTPGDTAVSAASAPAKISVPAADGQPIKAPMAGTITSVNFQTGAAVKKGDVLFILEALKLENEILAPADGKLASVNVSKGAAVQSGTLLCVLG